MPAISKRPNQSQVVAAGSPALTIWILAAPLLKLKSSISKVNFDIDEFDIEYNFAAEIGDFDIEAGNEV
jgi:hypothetical protein